MSDVTFATSSAGKMLALGFQTAELSTGGLLKQDGLCASVFNTVLK
jgi:hypothetical protein